MLKSPATVAFCLVIATAFSVTSLKAMPVPEAGDSELSAGLAQWGAETQAPELSQEEMLRRLDELAPPQPPRKVTSTKAVSIRPSSALPARKALRNSCRKSPRNGA